MQTHSIATENDLEAIRGQNKSQVLELYKQKQQKKCETILAEKVAPTKLH